MVGPLFCKQVCAGSNPVVSSKCKLTLHGDRVIQGVYLVKNKLKIAAIVAVVIIGMVIYKSVSDKREAAKPKRRRDDEDDDYN